MNSSFEKRVKEAHVEVGPVTATWWIGETGSWREAPGRGAPPHRTTSTWADFEGALREAARLRLTAKGDGPNFVLASMDRGYRGKAHVRTVHGITLDLDDPHTDVDAVRAWLGSVGLAYVMQVRGGKAHVHLPIDPIADRDVAVSAARVFLGEVAGLFPGVDLAMSRPEQVCFAYAPVGGSPVATLSAPGYALDLSAWAVPGALGPKDRVPGREYLLAAAGQWTPGGGALEARTLRGCREPHRSILAACLAGEAPALEPGGRNAALHAALWSLAAVDPELDPAAVARSLVLGGMLLDRSAEWSDPAWWSSRYENAAREIGVQRAAQAAEDADKGGRWTGLVQRDAKGQVTANGLNPAIIFAHDPDIAPALAWNRFSDRPEVLPGRALPWGGPGPREVHLDAEWYPAAEWLRAVPRVGAPFARGSVLDAIESSARQRTYDPLERYLRGLRWDGVPRISTWLQVWLGAPDMEIAREMGRRWLISGAARGLRPGCQVDSVLVLQGRQGLGKSSAFRALGKGWYSDRLGDPSQKDSMAEIQGVWILEIAELESMRHVDLARLKGFLTRTEDVYRAAYARANIARPRRCVFGATTNQRQFLADPTGARRWWCVSVDRPLDQAAFGEVVDQLWAEAVVALDAGQDWHLTGHLADAAAREADERREDSPWEDAIERWSPTEPFTTGEAFTALGVAKTDTRAGYQIRDALTLLGYRQIRPRSAPGVRSGARVWVRDVHER